MTISAFSNSLSASRSTPVVIELHSELVRGSDAHVLAELLPRVKRQSVALDVSCVERMDAAGIAALITLYSSSIEAGNEFCLLSPSSHVRELLKLVGLDTILISDKVERKTADCPKPYFRQKARESILASSAA